MVDLSTPDSVLNWLVEIQPPERRAECAVSMATRSALRVLPLLVNGEPANGEVIDSSLFLAVFRELSRCWLLAAYPDQIDELKADYEFNAFNGRFASSSAAERSVVYASNSVHSSISQGEPNNLSINGARAGANAIVEGAEAARMVEPQSANEASNWDSEQINLGISGRVLATQPLWPNEQPRWLNSNWSRVKAELKALNEGWEVWIDWYDARLSGEQPDEAENLVLATIPLAVFAQGSAATNRYIDQRLATLPSELPTKNAGFGLVLATRSALRAVPLLNTDERIGDRTKSQFVLSVFHALAVAWSRTQFPGLVTNSLSVRAARSIKPFAPSSASSAQRVGSAATEAAFCAGAHSRRVADSRARVARLQATQAFGFLKDALLFRSIIPQADARDENDIAPAVTPAQLGAIALWPGRQPPGGVEELWRQLRDNLLSANEGWEVWIDWYEARLRGDVLNEAHELAYVNYTNQVAITAFASQANSEIKRLIEAAAAASEGDYLNQRLIEVGSNLSISIEAQGPPSASTAVSSASSTSESFAAPSIESIPEQDHIGTRFGLDAEGRIDILGTPPATDDLQRLHYDEMRYKAQELIGLGHNSLGNIASDVTRIFEALPERLEDVSVDKLWSRANTLRRRHDAHVRTIDDRLGPDPARLQSLVAAKLGDLIDGFNVFIIGDPRGLELDRIRLGPQDREAARRLAHLAIPIAHAADEPNAPVTPAVQETLTEQISSALDAEDSVNGDQALELARKTTGNFISELLRTAHPSPRILNGIREEANFARKEARSGFYRAVGGGAFTTVVAGGVASYTYWPQISSFVVQHADALKAFVSEAYKNPALVEIINSIIKAASS